MTTLRDLDGNYEPDINRSSLEKWYSKLRDVPFSDFSGGDLSRACRQRLFLNQIIPHALAAIKADPLVGDLFEGELASVVARVDASFWQTHPELYKEAEEILLRSLDDYDDEVKEEIEKFREL